MMNKDVWERCASFHGHKCPGLAIGMRACEAAKKHLDINFSKDEEVTCVTENDACGVDAVQVITGCTAGKGNLLFRRRGKMAFSFFCRNSGQNIRVVFKKRLDPNTMDRKAMQEYILTAPVEELFEVKTPGYSLPDKARIFQSIKCEKCGESSSEAMIRVNDGKKVCLDCAEDYSRGW